ncbi:MAG: hypothetical protein RLZZ403_72 [Pseudomonadota bacterium]
MSTIFDSVIANSLKKTLNKIIDDKTDGTFASQDLKGYMETDDMEDAFIDDLEMGGPGLAVEKAEGAPIQLGTVREGVLTRYWARTFGLKLAITEEAMEDSKYPEALKLARRLKRAMAKTQDIDCANILNRMFNTAYVGGDLVPLGSASHTIPGGATYSNIMATPFSPSTQAVALARAQVRQMPGHDGYTEGYTLETVLCPVQQEGIWEGICYSKMDPTAGNFAAINIVNQRIKLEMLALKYWTASTTNYAYLTDCVEERPKFLTRRAPRSRTWVNNDAEVMNYSISARWARGWSGGRGMFCVQA